MEKTPMKCKKCKCATSMIDITKRPDADGMRKLMCDASTGGCGVVIKYQPTGKEKVRHIAKPEMPPPVEEPQATTTVEEPERYRKVVDET